MQIRRGGKSRPAALLLLLSFVSFCIPGGQLLLTAQTINANGYPTYLVDAELPIASSDGFSNPQGIAVTGGGTTFVADTGNHRVLSITSKGVQSTVSFGNLSPALTDPVGLARDGHGNLYVTEPSTNRVIELPVGVANGVSIIGTSLLNDPIAIAADAVGDLAVVNAGNQTIVVQPSGGAAAVFNSGKTVVHSPQAVAFDHRGGLLYVIDAGDTSLGLNGLPAIWKFLKGGGSGTNLAPEDDELYGMDGIAVDPEGNIFVSCSGSPFHNLFEVVPGGTRAIHIPGSVQSPAGVALDLLGNLYATSGNAVTKVVYNNAANFGAVAVGATTASVRFYFNFFEEMKLEATHTLGGGALGREYTLAPGSTCTPKNYFPTPLLGIIEPATCYVTVLFTPAMVGGRPGAVQLATSIGSMTQLTTGKGLGAQLALVNASISGILPNTPIVGIIANAADTELYFTNGEGAGGTYEMPVGGTAPKLVSPKSGEMAVDGAGNLFIFNLPAVTEIPGDGSAATEFTIPGLDTPESAVMDYNGAIYVLDAGPGDGYGFILRRSQTGTVSRVLQTNTWLFPVLSTADLDGNIFVVDEGSEGVYAAQVGDGSDVVTGVTGIPIGDAVSPASLSVDASGTLYFVNDSDAIQNQLLYSSPSGQLLPNCDGDYGAPPCILPLYTVPGVKWGNWEPFTTLDGNQTWTTSPSGKMYAASGQLDFTGLYANGAFVIDRNVGSIPRAAFSPDFQNFGGPTQNIYVYNIGNQNLHFNNSTATFTQSGNGAGSFTFGSTGGCEPGTTVIPGNYCLISVTNPDTAGTLTVTDSLHFLTNAVNNSSAAFQLNGGSTAK